MLAEFVQSIVGLAQSANNIRVAEFPGDPRHMFVQSGSGEAVKTDVPPPIREHQTHKLQDLVDIVLITKGSELATIWVGEDRVIGVFKDEDRRDRVTMFLNETEVFDDLGKLPRLFTQRELISFLNRNLHERVDESLVSLLRRVTFSRADKTAGVVNHKDESLGRSIESAVDATSDIPDKFTVSCQVFNEIPYLVHVGVHLQIDTRECTFGLQMLPDELQRALTDTLEHITFSLKTMTEGHDVGVFSGTP